MNVEWHDIRDPDDPELDRLAERYHLHPLHIEDCRHRNQSAKVEEFEGYIFVVLKPVELDGDGGLDIGDLDVFLGPDFLITVMETNCESVGRILDQNRSSRGNRSGDQVLYRIMDGVVDSYLPLLDGFTDGIDDLEELVLENPSPAMLQRIFGTKRSLIEMRRVLANMRDVAGHLQRTASPLISQDLWPFLRDVYDHLARNVDTIDIQRDLLSGAMDIYMSGVANRTNQVMKVLTVFGTIALPALIISSFYGMNLKHLPWVEVPHATGVVVGLMAASTVALLWMLKRFHWF
jgi:magnesium transporter